MWALRLSLTMWCSFPFNGCYSSANLRPRLAWLQAKLKGSAAAYNALGVMLYSGQDMPVDYEAALDMFDTGALLGDADAMFNLGAMHLAGHGVEPSPQQALAHFQEANDADHWQAPFQVASRPLCSNTL